MTLSKEEQETLYVQLLQNNVTPVLAQWLTTVYVNTQTLEGRIALLEQAVLQIGAVLEKKNG